MAFKPIDPKRDEYRRYLERGGIIESLTKVFVRILKERPEDPTQYLLQNLGDARLQADNIAYLQGELEDARMEIQRLTDIIRNINPDLLNESANKNDVSINSNEVPPCPSDSTNECSPTLEENSSQTHMANSVPSEMEVGQNKNNITTQ